MQVSYYKKLTNRIKKTNKKKTKKHHALTKLVNKPNRTSTSSVIVLVDGRMQPRSHGLSLPAPKSERGETLVWSGHVSARF